MAYVKTNWQNGVTPVNADNMNKIENELESLDQASGGGTQWYKHTIHCSTDDNFIVYIVLIDTNASAYTSLSSDFMLSLVANNKYILYNGTSYLTLFAEFVDVTPIPPGQPPQDPTSPGPPPTRTLTTYYLQNKSFVSFTINSITNDDVTPL